VSEEAVVSMIGNTVEDLELAEYAFAEVGRRPLEYRRAGTLEVRHPERTIELVAVPYDEETLVPWRGRMIRETVAPGAFAGVERRANRVKVNRAHEVEEVLGRALALHPERPEGLVAELRISRGPKGDEVLELASDGALDASVGFAPMPGGEQWAPDRSGRRITRAYLGHIALTADPAYDGARVLAVRSSGLAVPAPSPVATPNLDRILAERRARESGLDLTPREA
jgi:HK97 family phage prohead protease